MTPEDIAILCVEAAAASVATDAYFPKLNEGNRNLRRLVRPTSDATARPSALGDRPTVRWTSRAPAVVTGGRGALGDRPTVRWNSHASSVATGGHGALANRPTVRWSSRAP